MNTQRGFTVIELLVVLFMVALISTMSFNVYKVGQAKNQTTIVTRTVVTALRRAQQLSEAVDTDSQWGVKLQSNTVVLFRGASYAARVTSSDETITVPAGYSFSGVTEVVYSKMYGLPQSTGTITISGPNTATATVTLNTKGLVSY